MSYQEKLLDPRWKEKRQEVLRRDGYECQICQKPHSLQVHHCYYDSKEPWDYEPESLLTLCRECHEFETKNLAVMKKNMVDSIARKGITANTFDSLAFAFENSPLNARDRVAWNALCWAIRTSSVIVPIIEAYKHAINGGKNV